VREKQIISGYTMATAGGEAHGIFQAIRRMISKCRINGNNKELRQNYNL
jgi:hypothetical protein